MILFILMNVVWGISADPKGNGRQKISKKSNISREGKKIYVYLEQLVLMDFLDIKSLLEAISTLIFTDIICVC